MNRRLIIIIASAALLTAVLTLAIVLPIVLGNAKEQPEETGASVSVHAGQTESSGEPVSAPDRETVPEQSQMPDEVQTERPQESSVETSETERPQESSLESSETEHAGSAGEIIATSPDIPAETGETEVRPETGGISFPYAIPGTELVIDSVNRYNGLFLEDGSDSEISDVAAIILKNTGNRCIDYAEITMQGRNEEYLFVVSNLEAKASIVVQEARKSPCISQEYDSVTAEPACSDTFEMAKDQLRIRETSDNQLEVTNLTDQTIPCARIFYKFYLEEEKVYVGGITYVTKVVNLKPGATVLIAPSHFTAGSSRIVMVKIFDTDRE